MTAETPPSVNGLSRARPVAVRLRLGGQVQGVGYRPFVYRLAREFELQGWVKNELGEVCIQVQGAASLIAQFKQALIERAPPLARPRLLESIAVAVIPLDGFRIDASVSDSPASIHLPTDYYLCPDCERELLDPDNRRYRYPFINCTQCGPRYTLIKRLPYDRANTGMAEFTLCPECRREYQDPDDRRFHAEPIGCPACGPQLQYYAARSGLLTETRSALAACVAAIVQGEIVAVKGIGGYHLICDAGNDAAVRRLRQRKARPDKPLAVMFNPGAGDGLDAIRAVTRLDAISAAQLRDPARPIVLLSRRDAATSLSPQLAPGLDEIGVFLAYSPLHRLLLEDVGRPLVATSANLSGEPVLTNNQEVEQRLAQIADGFLHHNRPIERPADDSVYRVIAGHARPLRAGRGVAPLELRLPRSLDMPTLALGGHMKNTVALAWDDRVVISPHIGDLDAPRSLRVFEQVIQDLQTLYRVHAQRLVCDAHPAYASSRWAREDGRPLLRVQHHHAHASALAGEFPDPERWLVFTWDGTGYGDDESIWGGETFYGGAGDWQRLASLRPFRLPGGDKAGRQPWRSALAVCWETGREWMAPGVDTALLRRAWERHLNAPSCSAAGRLFDAAAALLGVCQQASYEAQAPLQLEALARQAHCQESVALPMRRDQTGVWRSDWSALLSMLLDTRQPVSRRAACWHESLARHILEQCQWFAQERGEFAVGLSGGVFQNRLLSERVVHLLEAAGFRVYLARSLPINDAGLCYGQIVEQCFRDTAMVPA